MPPFLASNQLIVTPVVVLIVDNTIRPILNTAEVALIFSPPFERFPIFRIVILSRTRRAGGSISYVSRLRPPCRSRRRRRQYRIHSFLAGREAGGTKPVFGLTASILIEAAMLGYGQPDFEVQSPGAPTPQRRHATTFRWWRASASMLLDFRLKGPSNMERLKTGLDRVVSKFLAVLEHGGRFRNIDASRRSESGFTWTRVRALGR
ncbi:hypothetical protein CPB85DRAFT_245624 [Mucidula mucida]|nr:hypothetical protein CPB85DRAFT_245624 [Mucidula mucida]